MGYYEHHAIVVTCYREMATKTARDEAIEIFGEEFVTEILQAPINVWYTFFIAPDGSKEGWVESDIGDRKREEFLAWIARQAFEDGSNMYAYKEIKY